MKTAEEYIEIYRFKYVVDDHSLSFNDYMGKAMKAYAIQVAEQALKDASKKATLIYESDSTSKISHYGCTYGTEKGEVRVDPESITSTPIVTP